MDDIIYLKLLSKLHDREHLNLCMICFVTNTIMVMFKYFNASYKFVRRYNPEDQHHVLIISVSQNLEKYPHKS